MLCDAYVIRACLVSAMLILGYFALIGALFYYKIW